MMETTLTQVGRRGRPPNQPQPEEETEPIAMETKKVNPFILDAEKAKASQKRALDRLDRQKTSPKGLSVGMVYDGDRGLVAQQMYVPDAVEEYDKRGKLIKPASMSTLTADPGTNNERHRKLVNEGWEPVLDEQNQIVTVGSDYFYKRPKAISDAQMKQSADMHNRFMRSQDESMAAANEEARKSGDGSRMVEIEREEKTVTTKELME